LLYSLSKEDSEKSAYDEGDGCKNSLEKVPKASMYVAIGRNFSVKFF